MAAKRTATSELNHTNWDQDDEAEDAGYFKRASEEALQKRVIKTARRRNPVVPTSEGDPAKSVFGKFSGFSKPTTKSTFSFLNNLEKKNETPVANGLSMFDSKTTGTENKKNENDDYLAKLKGLNESVANWIKAKVDSNPFINLQPIFNDYKKYFDELEKENKETNKDQVKTQMSLFSFKPTEEKTDSSKTDTSKTTPQFSVGANPSEKNLSTFKQTDSTIKDKQETKTSFSFGAKETAEKKLTFSFGGNKEEALKFSFSSAPSTTTSSLFSFGANAGTSTSSSSLFTFNSGQSVQPTFSFDKPKEESKNNGEDKEEDEDEPPKNEFVPVIEDGHIYSIKCKVFVKSDGKFGDRGVGMLYLKPVPNTEKVQLIVRADTSLGNLLCNFILSSSLPTKLVGQKDVMIVCMPTADSKPPPVPVLLRVKSPEDATQLLAELEKHKK